MTKEFEHRADLLGQWLDGRDIELVLWDLDDTILDTRPVFMNYMDKYLDCVHSFLTEHSKESLLDLMREVNNEAYKSLSVSPLRWGLVVEDMARYLNADTDYFKAGLSILMQIYDIAPEFLDGAEDALKTFRKTGLPMGLVTHATKDWTAIKIEERGLDRYFDKISIVNEMKFKGPEDWQKTIDGFGAKPERTMVIGDNLAEDIRASHSIGVESIVYFPGKWIVYNSGEIPEGTIVIEDKVKALVDTLISTL